MNFNSHSELAGRHAILSPSNYHWVNYTDQKLQARFHSVRAARRGTDLHDLAHKCIDLGVRMPKTRQTLPMYVNDGITFKMTTEQMLYYSNNCFGTADTIAFNKNKLRIHDLKTGITTTSHHQLEVYAAIFCLEYGISPYEIEYDLRIYQNNEVRVYVPHPDIIAGIMDTIMDFDKKLEIMKEDF